MRARPIANQAGTIDGNGIYSNSRFAFQVEVPLGMKPAPNAANTSQNSFVSVEGQTRLKVWADYNRIEETVSEKMQDSLDENSSDQVTYKTLGKNYFVLSGYRADTGKVFYSKTMAISQGEDQIWIFFIMEFPKDQKQQWDHLLEMATKSFKPIPGGHFQTLKELHDQIDKDGEDEAFVAEDHWEPPQVSLTVVPGYGKATLSWKKVNAAIGYNLYVSKFLADPHEIPQKSSYSQSATETVVEGLTNDQKYGFKIVPVFRNGEGSSGFHYLVLSTSVDQVPAAPNNFKIEPRNACAFLTWDPSPKAMGYKVFVSQDGVQFTQVGGTIYKTQVLYCGLTNGQRYYYAVLPLEFKPFNSAAFQQVIPGSGQSLDLPEEVKPIPTPGPDLTLYHAEKSIPLNKEQDGFDGALVLLTGREANIHWTPKQSEQYKWRNLKPALELTDSAGAIVDQKYLSWDGDSIELKKILIGAAGPSIYTVSISNLNWEQKLVITQWFQISGGRLDDAKVVGNPPGNLTPRPIILSAGQERGEAGDWKLSPSSVQGRQDILVWSTNSPVESGMHPVSDEVPITHYTRYHFDENQWLLYTRQEDGFVANSNIAFPGGDFFPDESYFPKAK